jgi:predicted amidophosphoribosyltransferase
MPNPTFEVANCPRCRRIFQKNNRNICSDCIREMDSALTRCLDFLRRNYRADEDQLSAETGVPVDYIRAWIKEGRLHISDYPNLNYPCSSCGNPIRQNKMCMDCLMRFNQDLNKLKDRERIASIQVRSGGFQIRDRLGH